MPITVAIVGSGPAGFYTAGALLKLGRQVRVDILERLPTPYGLVRAGVAPDHATTKNVVHAFERTARSQGVRFFGNVEVGRDVALDEVRAAYDAVVLATGGPLDRPSGIPGAEKRGVHGAAAFVGWYNAHPDFRDLDPDLEVAAVAVIGLGNVAIDVARVLGRTPDELAATDIAGHAARAIAASPLADIHLIGRRGPLQAKFTNVELREMGSLEQCVPLTDAAALPDAVHGDWSERERRLREKNLATLRHFAGHRPDQKPKRVHFRFFAAPVEVLGTDRVEGLRLERTRLEDGRAVGTGETFDIECGLVVSAIGYRAVPVEGAPFDQARAIVPNQGGRVADGLYVAGWAGRGPTGVISSNRADGVAVAGLIDADLGAGAKPGGAALEALLDERGVRWIDFDEWLRIDAAEVARAAPPAPRRKFACVDDMLAVLDGAQARRSSG